MSTQEVTASISRVADKCELMEKSPVSSVAIVPLD